MKFSLKGINQCQKTSSFDYSGNNVFSAIPALSFAQCTITFIPDAVGYGKIEPLQPLR